MTTTLANASVLITGGTGSFGRTMVRRLLAGDCAQVHVLSRDEAKQDDMRRRFGNDRLRLHLGDVRDQASVAEACRGVDYVFHAAALKQVPSCEFFPLEAVRTNVFGSANVIQAARAAGVRTVVCLSTDKAVYPVNAMGMSKALMEKVAQSYSRHGEAGDTVVCTVRYGNVLYSRGSVVPLFVELLKNSAPLTVTDPAMTRFLMSIEEAVGLVEHAFTSATSGDTFVRKAPASTIEVLARSVARLFEVEPKINIIGTRHGEKLHETLLSREEIARAEDQGEFFRIPLDDRSGNYQLYFDEGDERVSEVDEYNSRNTTQLDEESTMDILRLIPEVRAELYALGGKVSAA